MGGLGLATVVLCTVLCRVLCRVLYRVLYRVLCRVLCMGCDLEAVQAAEAKFTNVKLILLTQLCNLISGTSGT